MTRPHGWGLVARSLSTGTPLDLSSVELPSVRALSSARSSIWGWPGGWAGHGEGWGQRTGQGLHVPPQPGQAGATRDVYAAPDWPPSSPPEQVPSCQPSGSWAATPQMRARSLPASTQRRAAVEQLVSEPPFQKGWSAERNGHVRGIFPSLTKLSGIPKP